MHQVSTVVGNSTITLETGRLARLAHGAVLVTLGDTQVLVAVAGKEPREGIDFFPLTTDYRERTSAAGKIPGGFFKREGRPTTKEILTMRLMDRPIRPRWPDGFLQDLQISANVFSADPENDPDILAMNGASAALCISPFPFLGPLGSVRVGHVNGEFIINPTHAQLEGSALELLMTASKDAITMVEAGASEVPEAVMVRALEAGFQACQKLIAMQEELIRKVQPVKGEFPVRPATSSHELYSPIKSRYFGELRKALMTPGKKNRSDVLDSLFKKILDAEAPGEGDEAKLKKSKVKSILHDLEKKAVRAIILEDGVRIDGRRLDEIRPITCEVGLLPRSHGSALFTRGETQTLVSTTLGTEMDEQIIDGLQEEYKKNFMLHYNFPPFCVGEVRPIRGPGRREIGHGALAERSLEAVLPSDEDFPYTIRIVSDVLESNGSSSMASVCGGTLSLMDAGVPIQNPVAGIAMGLIKEGGEIRILSDILGTEDHCGDMDFKVSGTQNGITGLQMDIKVDGISFQILEKALEQAAQGRRHILKAMLSAIRQPRENISAYAPRIHVMKINPEKIGALIGPGGKNIRRLQEETSSTIVVDDDGTVKIYTDNEENYLACRSQIDLLTAEAEIGKTYSGRVTSIKDFGAFVEILPGQEGLVHVSELSDGFVSQVSDVLNLGDVIDVKVINIDPQGRIKLSRRALLEGGGEREPSMVGQGDRDRPRDGGGPPRRDGGGGGDRDDRGERRGGPPRRGGGGGGRGPR
jgi:polyribonucleotide nucleotidyltransferase